MSQGVGGSPPINPDGVRTRPGRDPWRKAPVSELGDQVLPRWFVLAVLAMIPIAIGALIAVFVVTGRDPVPVAARRPSPAGSLTTAVGDFRAGDSDPVPAQGLCPTLAGVRVAGERADRDALTAGLQALCGIRLDVGLAGRLNAFARAGGVVRFAQFEATGVDSTADLRAMPPRILVNARFSRTDPAWIAPLVAHDVTLLRLDPALASSALAARQVEAAVCERIFIDRRAPNGCGDAQELLSLDDPLAALREAGFR
ncbi:MAG: hypothetical protein ACRD0K_30680 [Egibacteraceae bacterium]